ncbi:MAG: Hsp20/alpha crystallin family protein [Candidatus Gracilibacteria bacterium]|nr:Hsp20/alpha crystallin family protein [Candidatus Gracilibacteria bacterium]MDQ7023580.1 Hsp20/alpha crystallin family protein [Candidatus Gracilibacteria bacterium]
MKIFGLGNDEIKKIDIDSEDSFIEEESDSGQIALDIIETPEMIIIYAPIAGIELDNIDLTLNKSFLTIKGNRNSPIEYNDNDNILRNSECYWGRFVRNIILPENLDFEMIKATMENNLLKITFPKIYVSKQNIKINKIGE